MSWFADLEYAVQHNQEADGVAMVDRLLHCLGSALQVSCRGIMLIML